MGISWQSGLGDALFTKTQQKVLGLLFGSPDRSFYANEIVRLAAAGTGAVQRELTRLSEAGLLTAKRVGNQKHYQASRESPLYQELRSIVVKTFGLADVLREALSGTARRIEVAFIYGSVARGSDTASSDIDLLIVGRDLSYAEVAGALSRAETALGRKVTPTIYSPREIRAKLEAKNAFLRKVTAQPKILLIGSDRDISEPRAPGTER